MSIFFFATVFPFMPNLAGGSGVVNQMLAISMKVLFMFPVAGIAYEMIRYSSKNMERSLIRWAVLPGLWLQKLTTREPSDEQLEVALAALDCALQAQGRVAGNVG
jgi:uncharacterized protein YqhQ